MIYTAELSDGRKVDVEADHQPSEEEILAAIGGSGSEKSSTPVGLSDFLPTEEKIASRPDLIKSFIDETKTNPYANGVNLGSFKNAMLQPFVAGLKSIGGLMQRGEVAVANPLMDIQEGKVNPSVLLDSVIQGIKGNRLGELGDLPRRAGFGEPLSTFIGLGSSAGLSDLLSTGKLVKALNKASGSLLDEVTTLGPNVNKTLGKITNGGLTKPEVARLETQYGGSNALLVDKIKELLGLKVSGADNLFEKTITSAPDNIKIKTDTFGKALQTSINDLKSGVGKENPIVARLQAMLDDIKGGGQVSKVLDASGNPVQIKSAGYIPMDKQTFIGTRRNLGDMLTGNGEVDRLIMSAKEALDSSAIQSGISDLTQAKQAYKVARDMESRFLNKNTGDLKVATEARLNRLGTDKPLSKQELDHIKELEKYIGHPITQDADKINKLNKARETIRRIKKRGAVAVGTLVAGELGRKVVTGTW